MLSPDIKQAVEKKAQELVREKSQILQQKVLAASGLLFSSVLMFVGGASTVAPISENQRTNGVIIGILGITLSSAFSWAMFRVIPGAERQAEDNFVKGMEMQQNLEALEKRLSVLPPGN